MQLDIQTKGFSLTESLRNYTEKRMGFALHRNAKHILRACVRLADINGSRGGVDKRCQIALKLAGHNSIVIEDTEVDLYIAIDRASERCMRTLARHLERLHYNSHISTATQA